MKEPSRMAQSKALRSRPRPRIWPRGVMARPHRYAKRCGREYWSTAPSPNCTRVAGRDAEGAEDQPSDVAPTERRHELRKWTHLFGFPASTCLGTLINSSGTSPLPTIHEKIAYPDLSQSRPSRIS